MGYFSFSSCWARRAFAGNADPFPRKLNAAQRDENGKEATVTTLAVYQSYRDIFVKKQIKLAPMAFTPDPPVKKHAALDALPNQTEADAFPEFIFKAYASAASQAC